MSLEDQLITLTRRVGRLENANFLENSSVKNGRLRFIGGLLLIDSGGTLTVIGHLNGDGDFVWDGPWALKGQGEITGDVDITGNVTSQGDFTQTGPWYLNGDGDIQGNADISGILTLLSQLLVKSGGKITVEGAGGNVTLDSSFSSPRVQLGSAQIDGGASSFTFTAGLTTIYFIDNTIRIAAMPTASSVSAMKPVYVDSAGKFWKGP